MLFFFLPVDAKLCFAHRHSKEKLLSEFISRRLGYEKCNY
jgi:hypothetical protein